MTRKNSILVLLGVLLIALLLLSFGTKDADLAKNDDSQEKLLEKQAPEIAKQEISEPTLAEQKQETSSPEKTSGVAAAFREKIENFKPASLQVMREEIAKNPHVAPTSGIASALAILNLYKSIQTKEEAGLFLTKMKDCSEKNFDTAVAVKSTCLKFSRRLLGKFPEMKTQVEEITAVSSERAIEMQNIFGKTN